MKKEFDAVVRHYHCADRQARYELNGQNHPPHSYSGLLKEGHDLNGDVKEEIRKYLTTLPDGELLKITIEGKGKSSTAEGFVWAYTKPHTYERITEQDYAELVEAEKASIRSDNLRSEPWSKEKDKGKSGEWKKQPSRDKHRKRS